MPGLKNKYGILVPNVINTLVVENRINTAVPYTPGSLHNSSQYPGDISAIGADVWSFIDARIGADNKTLTEAS